MSTIKIEETLIPIDQLFWNPKTKELVKVDEVTVRMSGTVLTWGKVTEVVNQGGGSAGFEITYFNVSPALLQLGQPLKSAKITMEWRGSPVDRGVTLNANGVQVASFELASTANISLTDPMVFKSPTTLEWTVKVDSKTFKDTQTWVGNSWVGIGDEPDTPDLESNNMVSLIAASTKMRFDFPESGFKWMGFPEHLKQPTKFVDTDTDFQVAMEPPKRLQVPNEFGVIVPTMFYRTTNRLGGSISIQTE